MSAQPDGEVPAPPAPARQRRRARATSAELVEAAIRVIGREGVAAATTRKIAEEAGVPLGTVHYWFDDKNDLLEDVVKEVVGRLEKAVDQANRPDGGASLADLRAGLHDAWQVVAGDDPGAQLGLYELTALALRTPSMTGLARRQYESYRATTARALGPALAGVAPERAAAVAQLVTATFDGLGLAWLADPDGTDADAVLDLLAELVVRIVEGG